MTHLVQVEGMLGSVNKIKPTPNTIKRCAIAAGIAIILCAPFAGGVVQTSVLVLLGVMLLAANVAFVVWLSAVFFRSRRVRLSEFIVIIAILGNIAGIAAQRIFTERASTESFGIFGAVMLAAVLFVSAGCAWGLWAADGLGHERVLSRILLMLLGILSPAAFLAAFSSGVGLLSKLHTASQGMILTFLVSCPIAIAVVFTHCRTCARLRQRGK